MAVWAFIRRVFALVAISAVFIAPPSFADDMSCTTIDDCVEEVRNLLKPDPSNPYKFNASEVGEKFASFDRAGFDALFDLAMLSDDVARDLLGWALTSSAMMGDGERGDVRFKLSDAEFAAAREIWVDAPAYAMTRLLSQDGTSRAHDFMIEALTSSNEEERYWASRTLRRYGLGPKHAPVDAKHLDKMLDLIDAENFQPLVAALDRIEDANAQEAMWALLESDDIWVFRKAFQILAKRDHSRLYQTLRQLTFTDSQHDKVRALMVAESIASQRRKIDPGERTYYYWRDWYNETDPSETAHIIPAYLLFDLYEKTSKRVSGAQKNIEDRKRWREYTRENPHGRPDYLSVERLTKDIAFEESRAAKFKPLLDTMTSAFTVSETDTLDAYFLILEASISGSQPDQINRAIPRFSDILDTIIQTPNLWAERFSAHLSCEPGTDDFFLLEQIAYLDPSNARSKSCLIARLTETNDLNKLSQTLGLIIKHEELRSDRDIRMAVMKVEEKSPFTFLNVLFDMALSDTPRPDMSGDFRFFFTGLPNDLLEHANKGQTYCRPENPQNPPYLDPAPQLKNSVKGHAYGYGARIMTVKTPSGYLAGHNSGEFGGGLIYHADQETSGHPLHERNTIAILDSNTSGIYWALAGLNHLIPGKGTLFRVDARTDDVTAEVYKTLPNVPNHTYLLPSGDLFLQFHPNPRPTYDANGEASGESSVKTYRYNPPVILTKDGEFLPGCGG